MYQYSIDVTIDCSLCGHPHMLQVTFAYYFPAEEQDWQDKEHGSIRVLNVENPKHGYCELSITEQIHIRRNCWAYLEKASLLVTRDELNTF